MSKPMDELAKVCMQELTIIRRAQESLDEELNRFWREIESRISQELTNMSESCGVELPILQTKNRFGKYYTDPKYKHAGKDLPLIWIEIRDPREAEHAGYYELRISWSGRKQFFKNSPGAKERLAVLAKDANIELAAPGETILCEKKIEVKTETPDQTIGEVGEAITCYYRLVTEFLKPLVMNKNA